MSSGFTDDYFYTFLWDDPDRGQRFQDNSDHGTTNKGID